VGGQGDLFGQLGVAFSDEPDGDPDVRRLLGDRGEGTAGGDADALAASRTMAAASSCTGTQTLMPSVPPT